MTEEKNLEAATSLPSSMTTAKDENYTFYRENRGIEYTAEEEKKVLRKIDLQLIPILFVIYLINVGFSHFEITDSLNINMPRMLT